MDLRIDEKGKYYTSRIAKDMLMALIRTVDQIIVGYVYVRPERRLKDELDEDTSRFLPVTDASVYAAESQALLYRCNFLLVSYDHIVTISPFDGLTDVRLAPWQQANG